MKKGIKTILLLIVFILFTTLNVYATDFAEDLTSNGTEVTLATNVTSAKVGDIINVTLSAKCETEISGISAVLDWDDTKLEFTNQDKFVKEGFNQDASGFDEVENRYELRISSSKFPKEADMATLSFKVLKTANVDEVLRIKLSEIILTDTNVNDIEITDQKVEITIVKTEENLGEGEGEENQGNGEQNPSEEQDPSEGEQKPSEEQKPDDTIAKKPINKAGIANYAVIAVIVIGVLAIILYKKCIKYRDVK